MFNHQEEMADLTYRLLGLELSPQQLSQFSIYGEMLLEWNEKVNLTSITDPREIIVKHFIDSLALGSHIKGVRIADLGTGAGFPGLPLKLLKPELQVVLVDSLAKRVDFLNAVIDRLALTGIEAIHARAEDFGQKKERRASFDGVVSRAVASLPVLLEYGIPLLKVGGFFYAAKGGKADEEVGEAQKALKMLGSEVAELVRFSLGIEAEYRAIIIVRKLKGTPQEYPRRAGTPAKKPLI